MFRRRRCRPQDYYGVAVMMDLDDDRKAYVQRIFDHISYNLRSKECCFDYEYLKTIREVDLQFRRDFFFPYRRGFTLICRLDNDKYYSLEYLSTEQLKELVDSIDEIVRSWNMFN